MPPYRASFDRELYETPPFYNYMYTLAPKWIYSEAASRINILLASHAEIADSLERIVELLQVIVLHK